MTIWMRRRIGFPGASRPGHPRAHTGFALTLALACLSAAGCGAHLSALHRGVQPPTATRSPQRHASRPAPPPVAVVVPRGPQAPFRLAEAHVAADSLGLAEAELRESLSLDPDYAPAMALLSKLYFKEGRYREGAEVGQPVRSRPGAFTEAERSALLAGLALHEDALGQPDRALDLLLAAHGGNGTEVRSAEVYLRLRGAEPDSATALARDALRHDENSAVNLNNFGITRLRAGDVNAARQAFTRAIARDPALPGPYYNLAILEKFYVFDEPAAARWFGQYWSRSTDDPDHLRAVFNEGLASVPVSSGVQP